jgi:hypothetical protein
MGRKSGKTEFCAEDLALLRRLYDDVGGVNILVFRVNAYFAQEERWRKFDLKLSNKCEYISEGTILKVVGRTSRLPENVVELSNKYRLALIDYAHAQKNPIDIDSPEERGLELSAARETIHIKPQGSRTNVAIDGFVVPIEYSLSTEKQLKTPADQPAEVTLDAEFNPFNYHPNVKFGFKKVRLKVEVPHLPSIRITNVLASKEAILISGGCLLSNGVVDSPTWDITLDRAFEPCRIATTDTCLFEVKGLSDGMVIESKIAVKLEDSVIEVDPDLPAASNLNARALMDFLCSQEAVANAGLGNYCVISEATSFVEIQSQ